MCSNDYSVYIANYLTHFEKFPGNAWATQYIKDVESGMCPILNSNGSADHLEDFIPPWFQLRDVCLIVGYEDIVDNVLGSVQFDIRSVNRKNRLKIIDFMKKTNKMYPTHPYVIDSKKGNPWIDEDGIVHLSECAAYPFLTYVFSTPADENQLREAIIEATSICNI